MMKGTRKGNLITGRYMITLTCITIAGCFLPLVLSSYMLRVMNIALISYMCVLSVYVLLGMCGQNSFAQAGFWGVGAYITANCLLKLNLGPIVSMIIAIAGTALFAFVLGFAFFRLKQYYFTFATIGLMTIFNGLFMNWKEVTGGALGISGIPPFAIFSFEFSNETSKFFRIIFCAFVVTFLMKILFNSSLGRQFMAIRDNELAAGCMGINPLLTKSKAFAIGGALCGLGGALYAYLSGYLSFQVFTYNQSTMYLIMIMLGGTINPIGALIGTMIISLLQEFVRPLQNYMQLIYGVGIMLLMIVQPEGILGGIKALYGKYNERKTLRRSEA